MALEEADNRPVPTCPGKCHCPIFSTPDQIVAFFKLAKDGSVSFGDLMDAMRISNKFAATRSCPFAIKGEGKKEKFRNTVCSIQCDGTYSTTAVSEGVGFSKTRVHQLEKSAMNKLKRRLEKSMNGSLEDVLRGVPASEIIRSQMSD